jgi:hypothetical protein
MVDGSVEQRHGSTSSKRFLSTLGRLTRPVKDVNALVNAVVTAVTNGRDDQPAVPPPRARPIPAITG